MSDVFTRQQELFYNKFMQLQEINCESKRLETLTKGLPLESIDIVTVMFCDSLLGSALEEVHGMKLKDILNRRHFNYHKRPQWIFTQTSLGPGSYKLRTIYDITKEYFILFFLKLDRAIGRSKTMELYQHIVKDQKLASCDLHVIILHPAIVAHYMSAINHALDKLNLKQLPKLVA